MKYPRWFLRLRWIVFITMCVHIVTAIMIHWIYMLFGGHSWDPPIAQLAQVFYYTPVWIIVEGIRMVLRLRLTNVALLKISSVLVLGAFLILNTILLWKNLEVLTLYGFFPFLGSLLGSLVYDCWFYIPTLFTVYIVDWIIVRKYSKDK